MKWLCVVAFTCFASVYAQYEGEWCESHGRRGVCVSVTHCQEVVSNLQNRMGNYNQIKQCGFDGTLPIVCCVTEHPLAFKQCVDYQVPKKDVFYPAVFGGQPADIKEFPHMVALGFGTSDNDLQWLCGGSLVSPNYVLTAAHCITSQTRYGPIRKVLAGTINKRNYSEGGDPQVFNVKRTIVHPDYKGSRKYHDIALIELATVALMNSFVKPACLHTSHQLPASFTATGFGKQENGVVSSDLLYKVDLVQYNNTYCNEVYETNRQIPEGIKEQGQVCAGGQDSKAKDTCQGDSGGPLHYKFSILRFLVGVTSFGIGCGIENVPGIYTRVSNYLPWIQDIVWK